MIQYRPATVDDAQSVKDIARRVIKTNYVSFLGADATTAFIESGMSDNEIDTGLDHCTLLIRDEQIIGFAITNAAVLHLIMMDPPFQNAGYGSKLLAHVENALFDRFDRIQLQTFQENALTVQFYLKHGWSICHQEEVPELNKTMLHFVKARNE